MSDFESIFIEHQQNEAAKKQAENDELLERLVQEGQRRAELRAEYESTQGTRPHDVLGDKAELVLSFLDFMKRRGYPGIETISRYEQYEEEVPSSRLLSRMWGVTEVHTRLRTTHTARGYCLGGLVWREPVIQSDAKSLFTPRFDRTSSLDLSFSIDRIAARSIRKQVLASQQVVSVMGIKDSSLGPRVSTRDSDNYVYICDDGMLRTGQVRNVHRTDKDEKNFVPGRAIISYVTHIEPAGDNDYSSDASRTTRHTLEYIAQVPLKNLLMAMAEPLLASTQNMND